MLQKKYKDLIEVLLQEKSKDLIEVLLKAKPKAWAWVMTVLVEEAVALGVCVYAVYGEGHGLFLGQVQILGHGGDFEGDGIHQLVAPVGYNRGGSKTLPAQ